MQWDGDEASAQPIIEWAARYGTEIAYTEDIDPDGNNGEGARLGTFHLTIKTLEGWMVARPGYWVIKGVKNEFYGCEPKIFRETYADFQLERSAEERLTDLMTDIQRIHKPVDEYIQECTEDVEDWPCATYQAVQRAQA